MATGTNIRTWFEGRWHDEDLAVMRAADHGAWLGTTVFDGARHFDGVTPDLAPHCARVNRSAEALMMVPTMTTEEMVAIAEEGIARAAPGTAIYVRPMYWALDGGDLGVNPDPETVGFAMCLEEIPMPPAGAGTTLTRTRFRRPVLEDNVVSAKAGCLYPNNARMLLEARSKGFGNALAADAMGNVAESATANVWIVKDGAAITPIPNGTFLAGITRARLIELFRADGVEVVEKVVTFEEVEAADEVFLSGNFAKVTPVTAFDDVTYQPGPLTRRARDLYWDWALSA